MALYDKAMNVRSLFCRCHIYYSPPFFLNSIPSHIRVLARMRADVSALARVAFPCHA